MVFLHCGWRSGGTWLWSLFRARPDVVGIYEPLHESLASISADEIGTIRPELWDSGHPDPTRPYFEELAPLVAPGTRGVRGYGIPFSTEEYFIAPGAARPALAAYLASLAGPPVTGGEKRPVLKLCRSLGRVGWMHRTFPRAAHLFVVRDPWSQWLSGWRLFRNSGSPYFITMPFVILTQHTGDAAVACALATMGLRFAPFAPASLNERYQRCLAALSGLAPEAIYRAFLALWVLGTLEAARHADAIVDVDRLARVPAYRAETRERIAALTGMELDLDGAREAPAAPPDPLLAAQPIDMHRAHALALRLTDALAPAPEDAVARATVRAKFADAELAARQRAYVATSTEPATT